MHAISASKSTARPHKSSFMDIDERGSGEDIGYPESLTSKREIDDFGRVYSTDGQYVDSQLKMEHTNPASSSIRKRKLTGCDLSLSIHHQPPPYVYSGEVFEIEYDLLVNPRSQKSPPHNIEISPSLDSSTTGNSSDVELVVLEPPKLSSARRRGKVKCKLKCSTISPQQAASVCIRLDTKGYSEVSACTTDLIAIVSKKLSIISTGDNAWGPSWYKDEGGREKAIEVHVQAFDRHNELLQKVLPLRTSLHYEGGTPQRVSKQSILRQVGSPESSTIDKRKGWKAIIKFRIEDVSKNHQNQNFVVQIYSVDKDVAPVITLPVRVRSKRNKKRVPSSNRPIPDGNLPQPEVGLSDSFQRTDARPIFNASRKTHESHRKTDAPGMREAVDDVVKWTEDTINRLYTLQWQVIGYAQGPDGRADFTRPYHSMSNPNYDIGQILSQYSGSTRNKLRFLQQSMQHTDTQKMDRNRIRTSQNDEVYGSLAAKHQLLKNTPSGQSPVDAKYDSAGKAQSATGQLPLQYEQGKPLTPSRSRPEAFIDSSDTPVSLRIFEAESPENNVEFVLAKQYKSAGSGEHLGFPAYSASHELLGFYREAPESVGSSQFVPIHSHSGFGQTESAQATRIFQDALREGNDAIHRLGEWGSIGNLIDHCLVYDFTKGI